MNSLSRRPVAPIRLVEIGEAARFLGVTARTLRHYEDRGLVRSHRLARNVRGYDLAAVELLRAIIALRGVGLSISAIRTILTLREEPEAQTRVLLATLSEALEEQQARIRRLAAIADRLAENGALPPDIAGLRAHREEAAGAA